MKRPHPVPPEGRPKALHSPSGGRSPGAVPRVGPTSRAAHEDATALAPCPLHRRPLRSPPPPLSPPPPSAPPPPPPPPPPPHPPPPPPLPPPPHPPPSSPPPSPPLAVTAAASAEDAINLEPAAKRQKTERPAVQEIDLEDEPEEQVLLGRCGARDCVCRGQGGYGERATVPMWRGGAGGFQEFFGDLLQFCLEFFLSNVVFFSTFCFNF